MNSFNKNKILLTKVFFNDDGVSESTEFNMFFDDSLFVEIREFIYVVLASSIEALYIIFGSSEKYLRQNSLSLDKYYQSICSYRRNRNGKVDKHKIHDGYYNKRQINKNGHRNKKLTFKKKIIHDHARCYPLYKTRTLG